MADSVRRLRSAHSRANYTGNIHLGRRLGKRETGVVEIAPRYRSRKTPAKRKSTAPSHRGRPASYQDARRSRPHRAAFRRWHWRAQVWRATPNKSVKLIRKYRTLLSAANFSKSMADMLFLASSEISSGRDFITTPPMNLAAHSRLQEISGSSDSSKWRAKR